MADRTSRKKIILEFMSDKTYIPMKIKEIAILLQVSKEERPELDACIDELLNEGKIEINKRGKYSLAAGKKYEGVFTSHADGYGFVTVEGKTDDYFVPRDKTMGAMQGDVVSIKLLPGSKGKRQEAEVSKIITHAIEELVGTFEKSGKGYGFVVPDNIKIDTDIFVDLKNSKGAEEGDKVVVRIDKYPEAKSNKSPEGTVVEILGKEGEPGVDVLAIAKAYGLNQDFDENVLAQADRVAKPVSEADMQGRLDLRDIMMVTIDGEDTKDIDDAVSLYMEDDIYVLGVHIADVTNYVQENSALDREALKRGTSVYLSDRVIPMLPKALSNGICSLNPRVDRLALSCIMKIDGSGKVVGNTIAETVINSNRQMTYTEVNSILTNSASEELKEECKDLIPMIEGMGKLAKVLRENRFKKGSIDFDFPESKVILDEKGHPVEIKPYDRNAATKLIEDFMLMANRVVAETYFYMELPFLYRIHDIPNSEKIKELALFISNFGYSLKGYHDEIHPKEIQKLLAKADGTPNENLISTLALRAMSKAKYSTACSGHFGLAFDHYCHFTSPIRRYPDLQIHRIIKENLRGRLTGNRLDHYEEILDSVAKHSTDMEIQAAEAERESVKLKKAEYMLDHLGEKFEGVISGVKSWGVYVELSNTIEGMIPIAKIPGDYYNFVESEYCVVGERTGRKYSLGQKVVVEVASVDVYSRTIDFALVEELLN